MVTVVTIVIPVQIFTTVDPIVQNNEVNSTNKQQYCLLYKTFLGQGRESSGTQFFKVLS